VYDRLLFETFVFHRHHNPLEPIIVTVPATGIGTTQAVAASWQIPPGIAVPSTLGPGVYTL